MKNFYKRLKIFYVFSACFLLITIIPAIIYNVLNKDFKLAFIAVFVLVIMNLIAIFVLLHYRNVIVEIAFIENNTIIKTNCKVFTLSSEKFIEVNDERFSGRISFKYADESGVKRFVFQKRYSPFKVYSLDINEMKKQMTAAIFKT